MPNAALFMQMRLGKTFCILRAFRKQNVGRILVVTPKSVIGIWCDEFETEKIKNYCWFSSKEWKKWQKTYGKKIGMPKWVVMNYECVIRLTNDELSRFDVVVVDESVRLKDPQTKTTKFFLQNFQNFKQRICLSGEPAPNTPLEYFTQFQFLKGKWMGCDNYWRFRSRYFGSDSSGWNWWPRGSTKQVIQNQIQKDAFVLSRKDAGVAMKKVYQVREVEMPSHVRKEYKRMEKEFVANLPDGTELETKYVLPQLSYLQQMAGGHLKKQHLSDFKIDELVYLLQTELKNEQVLVWSWFTWEIKRIQERLKKELISCSSITGSVPILLRQDYQSSFQSGKLKVLCMQVATGKYGLNLSRASTAIYFSNSLKPDDRNQSEYRIEHNTKKSETLLYIDIVTKNTVDVGVLNALKRKKANAAYFLGDIVNSIKERNK